MSNKDSWFTTLIRNIKINSLAYIAKWIFFIAVIVIIQIFSDSFIAKVLSALTYAAGISIDSYFLNKQVQTDSKIVEVILFFHMIIIWAGTVALVIIGIVAASKDTFWESGFFPTCQCFVNLFIIYSTITPLLEAIINCNGNQLTPQKEVE